MLATDEDAVICDFAETYHVLDLWALDLPLAATLAAGLAPDSRIRRKIRGDTLPLQTRLMALAVDYLALLMWFQSENGVNGVNRPASITASLTGQQRESDIKTFKTGRDFDDYWKAAGGGTPDGD